MNEFVLLLSLITYSVVVSQPLFYLVAMGGAQRALSAAAYVEVRQGINPLMARRVPVIYLSALAAAVATLLGSLWVGNSVRSITTAIAVACLIVDLILMIRKNVPINSAIDQWSTTSYPTEWESYRERWTEAFTYRQVTLLVGFAALLIGAVFG